MMFIYKTAKVVPVVLKILEIFVRLISFLCLSLFRIRGQPVVSGGDGGGRLLYTYKHIGMFSIMHTF